MNCSAYRKGNRKKVRKHLNADALFAAIQRDFQKIPDGRSANTQISVPDALMSAFAMFQLKYPSLLAFDKARQEEPENLHTIYGINNIPCDSQMRSILDPLPLSCLRTPFLSVFRQLQRGKEFEKLAYYDGHYLLSGDGTGFYCSEKVSSPYCMAKKSRNGKTVYQQQMYAASFVHPDSKVVIPVFPEMITNHDGSNKSDCERNAAKRFFREFRREHPHLKVIVVEDALSSNAPHIKELQHLDLRFILGAKPGDHKALFSALQEATDEGRASGMEFLDDQKAGHFFRYVNNVPLNKSNPDLLVNVLEYHQIDQYQKVTKFCWVTDIEVTVKNVVTHMRAGRAGWIIENETFNTLKNRSITWTITIVSIKKKLSGIFTILMMLALLVDQAQQLECWLFQAAMDYRGSKTSLRQRIRAAFDLFLVDSMETILRHLAHGNRVSLKT